MLLEEVQCRNNQSQNRNDQHRFFILAHATQSSHFMKMRGKPPCAGDFPDEDSLAELRNVFQCWELVVFFVGNFVWTTSEIWEL